MDLLTVREAADELTVTTQTVYNLAWRGEIASVKVGRHRKIVRESLDAYLTAHLEPGTATDELLARTRAGMSPTVDDPAVLGRVAGILGRVDLGGDAA